MEVRKGSLLLSRWIRPDVMSYGILLGTFVINRAILDLDNRPEFAA